MKRTKPHVTARKRTGLRKAAVSARRQKRSVERSARKRTVLVRPTDQNLIGFSTLANFFARQLEAHEALKRLKFLLYGGAMGGGKSRWLRWELIYLLIYFYETYHIPGVMAGLFCEDYPALNDRQLVKIRTEFPDWLGHYDGQTHNFYLSKQHGSGILAFRNLNDASKYASAEFAAIGVDELTKNKLQVFLDLRKRLRWPGIEDVKFLAGTNPGSIGHVWVKDYWLLGNFDPNETERDLFGFVRSKSTDNPYNTKSYNATLDSLPEKERKAYRDGSWDVFQGQFFDEWNGNVGEPGSHVCLPFDIPPEWERFISIDYGYGGGNSSVGWWAVDYNGRLYRTKELYTPKKTYTELALQILMKCAGQEQSYGVADPGIWGDKQHHKGAATGESGGETMANVLHPGPDDRPEWAEVWRQRRERGIPDHLLISLTMADNNRITGWGRMREMMRCQPDGFGESRPMMQVFSTCFDFIRTVPGLVHDDNNPEDVNTKGEDHPADEARYALMSRPMVPVKPKPAHVLDRNEMAERFRQQLAKKKAQGPVHPYLGSEV